MNYNQFDLYFKNLKNKTLYIGLSGGADSTVVLMLAYFYREKYHLNLKAVHFEHGIRGMDSIEDAKFCEELCSNLDIPFLMYSLKLTKCESNLEGKARLKRIQTFRSLVRDGDVVLLGHHADDKIENFFLRLSRGSNTSGLTSFSKKGRIFGINFSRPLFDISKKDIISFLTSVNATWRTDQTNNEVDYQRNFIRNIMLPKWFEFSNHIEGGINTAINNIKEDADFIEKYVDNLMEVIDNYGDAPLNIDYLKNLHSAIRVRVLTRYIQITLPEFLMKRNIIEQFNIISNSKSLKNGVKTLKIDNKHNLIFKKGGVSVKNSCN